MSKRFIDTTIQVDRVLENRNSALQGLLAGELDEHLKIGCSFSRLEFKRVVLQNLSLLLEYLTDENSYFTTMQRATRLRQDRRVKTLSNILGWVGHQIDEATYIKTGEGIDAILTIQSKAYIRNSITYLWKWFEVSLDGVTNEMGCVRGEEPPIKKKTGKIDASIPQSKCWDRKCRNAVLIKDMLPVVQRLCKGLKEHESSGQCTSELSKSLNRLLATIESQDFDQLYDYKKCVDVGDVWLHLECVAAGVKEFVTTNYKESSVLCPLLDLDMIRIEKPPPGKSPAK